MNIKKPLLRWSVAVLAVLTLTACGSTTSSPTTSTPAIGDSTSSPPAGGDSTVQKTQTGQVTFTVQFPQAALKKALMDARTTSIILQWTSNNDFYNPTSGSITLTPDTNTGLATATLDVPVGNASFYAMAKDNNGVVLDRAITAGEITAGNNTVYLTFLVGDWQFVDANDGSLPQSFSDGTTITTLAGFSLKTPQAYGSAAKATIDPTKPSGESEYQLQWHDNTPAAIGPVMEADQGAQFNAPAATGSSFASDWINITDPTRSDTYNGDSLDPVQGDRLVWILNWDDGDGPETITDANNVDLIPQFRTFGNTQLLDGNHIGGYLMAMTFESYAETNINNNVDCNLFWFAQQTTPAAARAAAIKASLTKAVGKAAIGSETTLTAGTATVNYSVCEENYAVAQIDGDGDGDNRWETLYDVNGNGRYDAGETFTDGDLDGRWDYTYYPGTSYDVTEQFSNLVAREFRAKGSQAGSVFTPPTPPVTPAAFSTAWLSGKTLYVVWFGEGRAPAGTPILNVPVVLQVTFNADGTSINTGLLNENDGTDTYGVTAFGLLYDNGDQTSGNTIVSGSTDQYIKTHYTVNGVFDNVDLLFYNQAEAMAFASTLTASIPPSAIATPPTAAAVIGTWIGAPTAGDPKIVTFLDEATYVAIEEGIGTNAGLSDFEYGNFIYDSTTGSFTANALVDTRTTWGPAGAGGPLSVTFSGNTMTIDGSVIFTKLAADPSKPIVGSWGIQESNPTVITFLADGTYYISQNIQVSNGITAGIERGTYTYSGTTLTATPIVQTHSGGAGFGTIGVPATVAFTMTGDNATFTGVDFSLPLKRVVAPATPAPMQGTWFMGAAFNGDFLVITFIDGIRYVMGENGIGDVWGGPGIEHGIYTYNNGAVTVSASIDTSGGWGLNNPDNPSQITPMTPFQFTMVGQDDGPFFLQRLFSLTDNPLIGTWGGIDTATGDGVVITFLDDGSFMFIQTSPTDTVGFPGNEWGTYTWDQTTGALSANILGDLNGEWGLSNVGQINVSVGFNALTGKDEMTWQDSDGIRLVPRIY